MLLPEAALRPPASFAKPAASGLEVAIRPAAAKRFGEPVTLAKRRPTSFGFGMSAAGESVVAWVDRRGRLMVSRFSPGHQPSAPRRLARDVRGRIALSVADDGTAIVLYGRGKRPRVSARTALPGGSFGPAESIARGIRADALALDAGDGGRGVVAWIRGRREIVASQRTSAGFQPARVIPSGDQPAGPLSVLATATESFVAIEGKLRICIAPANGRFGAAEPLLGSEQSKGYHVGLDADAAGRLTIVSERVARSNAAGIDFVNRPAGGSFGPTKSLTDEPAGLDVNLDVAPNGAAVVTWNDLSRYSTTIRGALRPAKGGFGKATPVGKLKRRAAILPSDAAIGPDGDAVSVLAGSGPLGHGVYATSATAGP